MMAQFMNPNDLRKITEDLELAERKAAMAIRAQADKVADDMRREFEARTISAEAPERINKAVRDAAERGQSEILVLRFPSEFTTDGGRSVNNFEPDWPQTLEGFAKTAFDYYAQELRPLGFTLRAEIMNFPGGMPGDVGMYLRW